MALIGWIHVSVFHHINNLSNSTNKFIQDFLSAAFGYGPFIVPPQGHLLIKISHVFQPYIFWIGNNFAIIRWKKVLPPVWPACVSLGKSFSASDLSRASLGDRLHGLTCKLSRQGFGLYVRLSHTAMHHISVYIWWKISHMLESLQIVKSLQLWADNNRVPLILQCTAV